MTAAPPLILGFVTDLMFTVKIENVARHLQYELEWIDTASLYASASQKTPEKPGEPLSGAVGALTELIVRRQPALLIFDLNNAGIPWARWIAHLKSSPATRRFPILAFGPHEDVATMQRARSIGADVVVARSRFTSALPQLLQETARITNSAALEEACASPLVEKARAGIALFNQGEYFDAHEELEHAWQADPGPGRDLYRAILQIAVAYLQVQRQNYRGALKMMLRVRQWLEPLPATCRTVNVARLKEDTERVHDHLLALGSENLANFDWTLARPVQLLPRGSNGSG